MEDMRLVRDFRLRAMLSPVLSSSTSGSTLTKVFFEDAGRGCGASLDASTSTCLGSHDITGLVACPVARAKSSKHFQSSIRCEWMCENPIARCPDMHPSQRTIH